MSGFLIAHEAQVIETALALAAFVLLKAGSRRLVRGAVLRLGYKAKEEREVARLISLLLVMALAVAVTAIWGVKQSEILVFAASVITVLGVAFFAEMSILSNVTACLVLFFQHPVRIGDTIRFRDQEQDLEGELVDITYFFAYIRTAEGRLVTVPNSLLLKTPFTITASKRA